MMRIKWIVKDHLPLHWAMGRSRLDGGRPIEEDDNAEEANKQL